MELPDQTAVMVLPETVCFPHSLVPLYIFEPRYVKMLEEALKTNRMFALCLAGYEDQPVASGIAGLGYIRACTQNNNGTANLLFQGVQRVKFDSFEMRDGYYCGKPNKLDIINEYSDEDVEMVTCLVKRVVELRKDEQGVDEEVKKFLSELDDYDMLMDIIGGSFLRNIQNRQKLLEISHVGQRLITLVNCLQEEYPPKR
ncbi:MAG: LON peptidase substrate-binding domain-containing protein [Verrucomicrobiota bacterium]